MKKIFMLIFAGLLILGCSKAEPKEDQQVQITTTPELVAGASYLPQLDEEIEQDLETDTAKVSTEEEAVLIPAEPENKSVTPSKTTGRRSPEKKTYVTPTVLPEPSEDEITIAIEKDIEEKITKDEEVTKIIVEEESVTTEPVEEKKAPMGIIILIGAIAAGGIGYLATRKKSVDDTDIE